MKKFLHAFYIICGFVLMHSSAAYAQIDPEARQLLHFGISEPLRDDGPQAVYLFYYWNMPNVPSTNQTLRFIVAPTYLNSELGFKNIFGPNTDLGVSVFGGAYGYNYDEIRQGNYYRDESFDGSGGGGAVSVYHLFNPDQTIPLNGIVRVIGDYRAFGDTSDTASTFTLPQDQTFITLRTGLRWGGVEPLLFPRLSLAENCVPFRTPNC